MEYSQEPSVNSPVVMGGIHGSAPGNSPRKKIVLLGSLILIVAIALVAIVLFVMGRNDPDDAVVTISETTANATVEVNGISPATIKVKKGQQIIWTNNDSRPHQLTADQETVPGFDSTDALNRGDSYIYTFETSGTFHYYDPADPAAFTGTVTVE